MRTRGFSHRLLVALKQAPDGMTVAGRKVRTIDCLQAGDMLQLRLRETDQTSSVTPVLLPLCILYEDEDVLIVNKPAGMAVHPSFGNRDNTLANALAWQYAQRGQPFVFRPIGRLDKNTSGLVALAKNAYAACRMTSASGKNKLSREYLAVCEGIIPARGAISAPIGRVDGSAIARQVRADGDRAVTHYERLAVSRSRCLARVWLETGRTHQIRVHFAHLGCPLTGDFLYGQPHPSLNRHALHAFRLTLRQPYTGQPLQFTAPLPPELSGLLES